MKTLLLVLRLVAVLCVTVLVSSFVLTIATNTGTVWCVFVCLVGSIAAVVALADYIDDKTI